MNLKIASLIINDLRILRLQGFKARKRFRRILTPPLSSLGGGEGEKRGQCADAPGKNNFYRPYQTYKYDLFAL
jgi:hypothetical protein